jgi:hypothetical protein
MFKTIFGEKNMVFKHRDMEKIGMTSFRTINTHVEFQLPFSLKSDALL